MIWTLAFWQGAGERALKTFAQSFLAAVGVNAGLSLGQVSWAQDASIAAVATILSLFTSIGNASFTAGATAQANASALLTKNLGGTQPDLPVPIPHDTPAGGAPLYSMMGIPEPSEPTAPPAAISPAPTPGA